VIKIAAIILVTPTTNQPWLLALLEQIAEISELYVHIVKGSNYSATLGLRRNELIQEVPSIFTHVMFIDDDDLISVPGMQQSILELKDSLTNSLVIQEQQFNVSGLIGQPRVCCRCITDTHLARIVARLTYAKGLPDKAYATYLLRECKVQVSSQVSYYWRRHDKQISKRGS